MLAVAQAEAMASAITARGLAPAEEVEARLQLALMMSPSAPRQGTAQGGLSPATAAQRGQSSPHELHASVFAMQQLWALSCELAEVTQQRNSLLEAQPSIKVEVRARDASVLASVHRKDFRWYFTFRV